MRALIFELRPGNLEQDGLIRALRTHTAALQGRIGLPVVVESTVEERLPLPDRGGPLPDRPGSPAQRRQARHRPPGAGRGRPDRERRPAAHQRRRQGLRSRARPGRPPRAGRDARPRRPRSAPGSRVRSVPGEGTTIEVVVPDAAIAAARCARRSPPRRPRSATDDVGRLVVRPMAGHRRRSVPRASARGRTMTAHARRPRPPARRPLRVRRRRCRRPGPGEPDPAARDRRPRRGRGRRRRRPARARPRRGDRIPTSSSSTRACPRSTAGSTSSAGSGPRRPASASWS